MRPKNILLFEPGYKNKYPPLGLMKVAQYHRQQNKNHNIIFAKGEDDPKLDAFQWDRIYITTLFSFEWKKTARAIDRAIELVGSQTRKIFVGGIAASLMTDEFHAIERWQGIRFIQGLLSKTPATALKLEYHDFGCRDFSSTPIEEQVPDYSILDDIEYQYPVRDAYFGYASRGCVRKCSFCGVPKLEGGQKDMPPITNLVQSITSLYGERKDLILMDNNVTAAPRFHEIMAEIRDLGFTPGAKLKRGRSSSERRVDFNQGVDARILAKNSRLIKDLATICIDPLRIAFDHLGVRKYYEKSIREAAEAGITSLSNYMLYNFHDTPEDLYQRLRINIDLNEELGIRIWSFPMRYQPVNLKDRSHIGKHWNRYFLRSFQIILQATHGVVTGNPKFFNHAFGTSEVEFRHLLALPHEFIFHRKHYFLGAGQPTLVEFSTRMKKLSQSQLTELIGLVCGAHDRFSKGTRTKRYEALLEDRSIDASIRELLHFYAGYTFIGGEQASRERMDKEFYVPEDIRVEDAGLFDDDIVAVAAESALISLVPV